jgi:hypothetical protein
MRAAVLFLAIATNVLAQSGPAVVNRPVANLFSNPTFEADVVSQAIYGWNVQVVDEQPHWLKVGRPTTTPAGLKRALWSSVTCMPYPGR